MRFFFLRKNINYTIKARNKCELKLKINVAIIAIEGLSEFKVAVKYKGNKVFYKNN